MIKIAPSILSADFAYLGRDVETIATADYVHFDVMDGIFVPNISIGIPVLKSIRKVTGLPIDAHLMIVQPVHYVEQFCDAGADIVTCHVEADTPENIHLALEKIHAKGKKAGVVAKPNTRAEAVLPFVKECDIILVMTVEPGFGGQKFMADMMPKVAQIKKLHRKAFALLSSGGGRRRGRTDLQDLYRRRCERTGRRQRGLQGRGYSRKNQGTSRIRTWNTSLRHWKN